MWGGKHTTVGTNALIENLNSSRGKLGNRRERERNQIGLATGHSVSWRNTEHGQKKPNTTDGISYLWVGVLMQHAEV